MSNGVWFIELPDGEKTNYDPVTLGTAVPL